MAEISAAKIKVLVVDDSALIRSLVTRLLAADPKIEVVGEAEDPYVARDLIKQLNPDVLTLDIEMPKMDGITFLRNLMRLRPMPVVMLSTLTTKGADVTLEALAIGAVDFIAKPTADLLIAEQDSFSAKLVTKVKQAAGVDQQSFVQHQLTTKTEQGLLAFAGCGRINHLVAIGASTGGTEAIQTILMRLPVNAPPVVIAQHIPPTFSARFAERLNKNCQLNVQEARDGQKLNAGCVYIAPGGRHLVVTERAGILYCQLEDSPEVNRHRPAVDVLFRSLVPIANNVQALLLTGMGNDGAEGLLALKQAGGRAIIQNQQSSLIWGMPGSAAKLNAYTDELDIHEMAATVLAHASLTAHEIKELSYAN